MFFHYFKIAFRNMRKYKNQTLISILGLAVGFTCFALATLWIRYEMTYDSFLKKAKQLYVVYIPETFYSPYGISRSTPNPLPDYLKETFPEIANATMLHPALRDKIVTVDGVKFPALTISTDSSFLRMFDVKILEGSREFLIPESRKLAITREKARLLFGEEHPIGKTVDRSEICAIVSGMPKQSNYPYDLIGSYSSSREDISGWNTFGGNTIIELFAGTNVEAFEKKLYEHGTGRGRGGISGMTLMPLTKMRYTAPDVEREVKFQHIFIFAVSGLLVVLCSLFNYLALFVSRFRMRQKELALRVVCGASGRSLLAMLSVEFLLTLLFAVLLGCMFTQLAHKPFLSLSDIQMNLLAIYRESFLYIGGVILVSLLVFWLILFIFNRMSLNVSIRRSNNKMFRKVSVIAQLIISIGFAFCTIVILKQMYFLHHSGELGFSFKNRGTITTFNESDVLANLLKQIPEITEVFDASGMTVLLPHRGNRISFKFSSWDEQPADVIFLSIDGTYGSPEYIAFHDFRLIAGEMLTDADPDSLVLLNESAVKSFGWYEPVGKHFAGYTVKGVIKNVYNFAPTIEAKPTFYAKPKAKRGYSVMFKYHEGMWKSCKEKIEQMIEKMDLRYVEINNSEEIYDNFLKSEKAVIKLLSFVSAICILICVFGFVSLVSLTCEERRKEIAIRKVNGATAGDILDMFAKEYFLLLLIGAIIAFTTGYFIMQRWLEQYVKQTSIPAWIYVSIVLVLALVIVLCVGWQVYRASVENPADVVKSE